MDRIEILLKKYEMLGREWNAVSTVITICFSTGVVGFVLGLAFNSFVIIMTMYAFMSLFAVYDLKLRTNYIKSKKMLESEIYRLAKVKPIKIKEVVERTLKG